MYQDKVRVVDDDELSITVAIPTYNRFDKLKMQVDRILPQLSKNDFILILDNATPTYSLGDLLGVFNDERIIVDRNEVNIGANANIIKCFERVKTEWMWLLSDDDIILPNALDIIKGEILKYDVDFINFSSELLYIPRKDTICESLSEYVYSIRSGVSNHLLMSNNIYRVSSFSLYLSFSYWGVYINAPHLVPILVGLQNGSSIFLSSKKIVEWECPTSEDSWRFSNLYNLLYLPDVICSSYLRMRLIKLVIASLPPPEKLVAQLAFYKKTSNDNDRINSYAKRILNIYIEYGHIGLKVRAFILKHAIKFPCSYLYLLNIIFKNVKGKSIYQYLQKGTFQFYI